jgi:hypothetical protein
MGNRGRLVFAGAVISTLAAVAAAAPPEAPPDTKGWREATWGMTQQQVLDAFKGEVIRNRPTPSLAPVRPEGKGKLEIPSYEINGAPYAVSFGFDDADHLTFVFIASIKSSQAAYAGLSKLLTEKYGPPTTEDRGPKTRKTLWRLPSTTIELEYELLYDVAETLTLNYAPRSAEGGKL